MIFLDLWGRQLGIPYLEYSVMPLGELHDLIAAFQILSGASDEEMNEKYIPELK